VVFRLYHRPGAGRPVRVVWALEEAGVPYEVVRLSMEETKAPQHRGRHPLGRVPVLEDDDGPLFESAGLCLHIADLAPGAGLIPPPGDRLRALVYQWVLFTMTELEPPLLDLLPGHATTPDERAAAGALLHTRLAPVEARLAGHDHLVGDGFTVADVVAGSLLADLAMLGQLDGLPAIAAYVERLEARPARERAQGTAGIRAAA
jgi:glutathione S-transferase